MEADDSSVVVVERKRMHRPKRSKTMLETCLDYLRRDWHSMQRNNISPMKRVTFLFRLPAHVSERTLLSSPQINFRSPSRCSTAMDDRARMPPSLFQVPVSLRSKASTHLNLEEEEKEEDSVRNAAVAQGMQIVTKLPHPVLPSTSGKRNGRQANLPSRIGNAFSRPRQVTYSIFVNARVPIRLQTITIFDNQSKD